MFDLRFDPYLMDDGTFGRNYVGSKLERKNHLRRKKLAKMQGRKLKKH